MERVRKTSIKKHTRTFQETLDIKSMIDGSMITKTKDIYCTLEIGD